MNVTRPINQTKRTSGAYQRWCWWTLLMSIVLSLLIVGTLDRPANAQTIDNPVTLENQQPGTDAWRIGQSGFQISADSPGQIKGYASATSVNKGENITFHVTVNPAQAFSIDIYRMGWYGGQNGRLIQHVDPIPGIAQPACPTDSTTGLIACNWAPSYQLVVPDTWTSGVYLALMTNEGGFQNYIIFVVRDDARTADLLFQQSVTTYQAYNNYPNDARAGKSLYPYNSRGPNTIYGDPRAVKVSFDRPYAAYSLDGVSHGAGQFFLWELPMISWLERMGYDVVYSTDIDTHANGARLQRYRGYLSVGHDEYWSRPMYDAAEAARDAGVNLGFFGGNDVYWQVRFEPSTSGAPDRVMVCYKRADIDPVTDSRLKTVRWRDAPLNRPEQRLLGIMYTAIVKDNATGPYVVTNSDHWVYAGTGFRNDDSVPSIVGYETDRYVPNLPRPANTSYTLLSNSPVIDFSDAEQISNAVIYQAPSGARVFAAGTIAWSWGLDKPGYTDARIQRMTANILDNFTGRLAPPPTTLTPTLSSPTPTLPIASPTPILATPTPTTAPVRCFPETTQCVGGAFRVYWEQNGALPVFGFPRTPVQPELNVDTLQFHETQWFERNRFERHPENAPPYDVLLGRLGDERLRQLGVVWWTLPRESGPRPECLWFAETGHNVCDHQLPGLGFRSYWEAHGLNDPRLDPYGRSLALFGLPLTEARIETNSSGDTVLTQWFERARFEWHPDKPDEFKVLLGLLGNELKP